MSTTNPTSQCSSPVSQITANHERRDLYLQWLEEISTIPTASGHEDRVIAWVERWLADRPDLRTRSDAHGNIEIRFTEVEPADTDRPIYFTAHLDHPAFVCCGKDDQGVPLLEFRGGVMAEYFVNARVVVMQARGDLRVAGSLTGQVWDPKDRDAQTDSGGQGTAPLQPGGIGGLFPVYTFKPDDTTPQSNLRAGDIGIWELPAPQTIDDEFGGIFYTNACDDLAALAAALAAMEELRRARSQGKAKIGDVRILLTRAEEIGFIGAIGACEGGFMPSRSRIIALENSRSFPGQSPIHGGPIVRVGDRISVFSPELTAAISEVAKGISGRDATPRAQEKEFVGGWKWQRKLMAGGACEASVFCAYGYEATCVCLPLGNYHNMANLAEVQAGEFKGLPRVGQEHIGIDDFFGMVDLLVGCGIGLDAQPGFRERVTKLWTERKWVVGS